MPLAKLPRSARLPVRSYATTSGSRPPLSGLSATAKAKAEKISQEWKGTSATGENTKNFVGGEFVESKADKWIDVVDPVCPQRVPPARFCLHCARQRKRF